MDDRSSPLNSTRDLRKARRARDGNPLQLGESPHATLHAQPVRAPANKLFRLARAYYRASFHIHLARSRRKRNYIISIRLAGACGTSTTWIVKNKNALSQINIALSRILERYKRHCHIDMARSFLSRPGVGDDNVDLRIQDGLSIRRAFSRERGRILARTGWQELSGTDGD